MYSPPPSSPFRYAADAKWFTVLKGCRRAGNGFTGAGRKSMFAAQSTFAEGGVFEAVYT